MAGPLADMVRAKYPGAYDDLSDADLEASIAAKYPGVYDDLVEPDTPPSLGETVLQRSGLKGLGELVRRPGVLSAAGGVAGGVLGAPGGPVGSAVLAGLGGAAGEGISRVVRGDVPEGQGEQLAALGTAGATQAGLQAGGSVIGRGARGLGRGLTRAALGAQSGLRRRFPTVNLEDVALRERAVVGSPKSARRIEGLSKRAGQAVPEAGRAADVAGAPSVQFGEIAPAFQRLARRASNARLPESVQQISQEAQKLRGSMGAGVSVEDALTMKTARQASGRAALPSATDPRFASTAADIDAAVSGQLAGAARGRSPAIGQALTRSQEMLALEKALRGAPREARLRTLLGAGLVGGGVGGGAGGADGGVVGGIGGGTGGALTALALASPRGQSLAAQGLARFAEPTAREAARLALLGLLGSQEEEENNDQR